LFPNSKSPVERLSAVILDTFNVLIETLLTFKDDALIKEKLTSDGNSASLIALMTLLDILIFVPAISVVGHQVL
jgi:hypothetical protein